MAADTLLAEAFFLVALALADRVGMRAGAAPHLSGPLPVLLAVLFPVVVASRGLYRLVRLTSRRGQAMAGLRATAWSIGLSILALFLFAREIPGALRVALTLYHILLGVWMVAVRPLLVVRLERRLASAEAPVPRVLIFGSNGLAADMARRLTLRPGWGELVAFADQGIPADGRIQPFHPVDIDALPDLAEDLGADLVVLARPGVPRELVVKLGDRLTARGIRVRVAGNVFNTLVESLPFECSGGLPLVPVANTPLTHGGERAKRAIDLAGALVGGILVLPLILVLALLVRLSSPGPVLYRQVRVGRGGRPFVFYKFRSMRNDGDDSAHREYVRDLLKNGGAAGTDGSGKKVYKLVNDARITRIGHFLRRTSLDELPQLINVIRGEMSLVGPRPCLPFEYELYKDWQKRRLDVTPGMTGLWQVTGRSYVTFEDMVLLDLFYIGNWSVGMDLRLLLRTVPVMVWGKGGA